jgi:DNA (cytosine-5)-methyltransferase 1
MPRTKPIPVIDLFAGPGGLGEGFSSFVDGSGSSTFRIGLSIEKEPVAHRTLELRALFRILGGRRAPECIYDHFRGTISHDELFAIPALKNAVSDVRRETRCATLGSVSECEVDAWIEGALGGSDPWVLVGGPPCQAYSLVGRARRRNEEREVFEGDHRHVLYEEYLRIIRRFRPAVFVMENVKGILSSKLDGSLIFERIQHDFANPRVGLRYEIRSFSSEQRTCDSPADLVIRSEQHGVPQARHRVILLGIRMDFATRAHRPLQLAFPHRTVDDAIGELPSLRSRLSRELDSPAAWHATLAETTALLSDWKFLFRDVVIERMADYVRRAHRHVQLGGSFMAELVTAGRKEDELLAWLRDDRLGGYCSHESRGHMRADLHRYLFVATMGATFDFSPRLGDFPPRLLPAHENVKAISTPFDDRFRVQLGSGTSTTIVSHIAKDGHYYIHPDPAQARSLTVREAARLQTFPDNYYFAGNRTEQFVQVGNAVPPFLARQLAACVYSVLAGAGSSQN